MDYEITFTVIWLGCFPVVAIDSIFRGISPWFWRLAALFGGLFTMLAYGLVRERVREK